MEDGRRPKWKTTKLEDNKMKDDQNGREAKYDVV